MQKLRETLAEGRQRKGLTAERGTLRGSGNKNQNGTHFRACNIRQIQSSEI